MRIQVITVGRPQLSFAKEGIEEYKKRLSRMCDIELHHIKENKDTDQKIIKRIANEFCILLDEAGKQYSTRELSAFLEQQKNQSMNLCFVLGGPDGHTETIRNRGDMSLSLSQLTFPHDIAIMITFEALYRGFSILEGHPYHRD